MAENGSGSGDSRLSGEVLFDLAVAHHEQGRLDLAAAVLRRAIAESSEGSGDELLPRLLGSLESLEDEASRKLVQLSRQLDRGHVSGEAIRGVAQCIGVFLGRDDVSCDMVIESLGRGARQRFAVYTGEDEEQRQPLYARISEGFLYLETEEGKVLEAVELPLAGLEAEELEPEELDDGYRDWIADTREDAPLTLTRRRQDGGVEVTFRNDNRGHRGLLQLVEKVCPLLKERYGSEQPWQLRYVLHGEARGEWDGPFDFAPDDWERALTSCLENQHGWQLDFHAACCEEHGDDADHPRWDLEAHANPAFFTRFYITGDADFVELVERLLA